MSKPGKEIKEEGMNVGSGVCWGDWCELVGLLK